MIDENPWGTIVSATDDGLVASHYPIMLDDQAGEEMVILTHVGRPDDRIHQLGEREVLLIVQSQHGYISPSWYAPDEVRAPTWNFSVAHCYGTPEVLGLEDNIATLTRLVERFERNVEEPMWLERDFADKVAPGTVGLRIPIDRFTCKVKMSQDKKPQTRELVLDRLREPGPYEHQALANEMQRALDEGLGLGGS